MLSRRSLPSPAAVWAARRRPVSLAVLAPIALAALLVGMDAPVAHAQSDEQDASSPQGGPSPFRAPTTIDIDFRGGSIGDYLEAVKQAAAPMPVNVIISDDVARLKANPVELTGVSVETALYLLMQGQVLTPEPLSVGPSAGGGSSAPVYIINARHIPESARRRPEPPAPERSVRVYSIRDFVEPEPGVPGSLVIDPETIISSIDAALSLHGESDQRDVLFHPDAGILIVRAGDRELTVVTSLLQEIQLDMQRRRESARRAAEEVAELEHEVMRFESQRHLAEAELEIARRRLERVQQLQDSGASIESDVDEARLRLLRADAEYQAIIRSHERAREALQDRRSAAPAGDDRQSLLNEITRLKAEVAALRAQLGRSEGEGGEGGSQGAGRGGR